ncbi:actin, cytoplasmic 2 [Streptomyces vinaceus]|uniref:actin, cytoplasmic 2 n=1 Tax=Streptomyces vinaceus TaxID=1960 RepID=UPI0035E0A434
MVIDNGSGLIKAGFAGVDGPAVVFPNLVGRPKHPGAAVGANDLYVGDKAQANRGVLTVKCPVEAGRVTDWEDMAKVWAHTFEALGADPSEQPVLLTAAPLMSKADRERMAEVMLETFNVPGVHVALSSELALSASGRTTGLVVDLGDRESWAVPVVDGRALDAGVTRVALAGFDLTHLLSRLLVEDGTYQQRTSAELEIVRGIKEKLCFVAEDYDKQLAQAGSDPGKAYVLPDGNKINVGSQRFACPEALFQPSLTGHSGAGLPEAADEAIRKSGANRRDDLFANTVLVGGTSLFSGLSKRLSAELSKRAPSGVKANVVAAPEGQYAVWHGGSTLAEKPDFQWVTKAK